MRGTFFNGQDWETLHWTGMGMWGEHWDLGQVQVCFPQALLICGVILLQVGLKLLTLQSMSQTFCKSGKPCPHCTNALAWSSCVCKFPSLCVQAEGFPGAAESPRCPVLAAPSVPHSAAAQLPQPLCSSLLLANHPTPATFCQPYSSQWSIIAFLCSHWWLLEGAALCHCSNWNHNLCSNEYLSRVHHSKWENVNPKSLQKLTGKGWLAGTIHKWWILPRTKLLCIISLHIMLTF